MFRSIARRWLLVRSASAGRGGWRIGFLAFSIENRLAQPAVFANIP